MFGSAAGLLSFYRKKRYPRPDSQLEPGERQPAAISRIAIDVGDQDGLRVGAGKLHSILDSYGVPNVFEIYSGTHTSKVADRFQNHVMPFFAKNLCRSGNCK